MKGTTAQISAVNIAEDKLQECVGAVSCAGGACGSSKGWARARLPLLAEGSMPKRKQISG